MNEDLPVCLGLDFSNESAQPTATSEWASQPSVTVQRTPLWGPVLYELVVLIPFSWWSLSSQMHTGRRTRHIGRSDAVSLVQCLSMCSRKSIERTLLSVNAFWYKPASCAKRRNVSKTVGPEIRARGLVPSGYFSCQRYMASKACRRCCTVTVRSHLLGT